MAQAQHGSAAQLDKQGQWKDAGVHSQGSWVRQDCQRYLDHPVPRVRSREMSPVPQFELVVATSHVSWKGKVVSKTPNGALLWTHGQE